MIRVALYRASQRGFRDEMTALGAYATHHTAMIRVPDTVPRRDISHGDQSPSLFARPVL